MGEMINLKPFKQSRGFCGPASLKMVFSAYNINLSEKHIARMTKSNRKFGCKESEIISFAKRKGFNAFQKFNSSINELKSLVRNGIPVIVEWFSPDEASHYSVIVGFKNNKIFIADPHFGKIIERKIKWFNERWFDVQNDKLYLRGMIVIYKGKLK